MITLTESERLRARVVGAAETEQQWCWWIDETPHGPFASRAEAIKDAANHLGTNVGGAVWCGPVEHVDASHYVADALDVDDLLERADQRLGEVYSFDRDVFYVDDAAKSEAEAELFAALKAWADKHVGTNCAWHCPSDAPDVAEEVRAYLRGASC